MTIIDNQVSGSSLSKYTYTYDDLRRRSSREQTGSAINTVGTDAFSYNSRSEVIGSTNSVETATNWNPTYDYDKIGNRLSSTGLAELGYTANALNQYSAITDVPSSSADLPIQEQQKGQSNFSCFLPKYMENWTDPI